MTSIDRTAYPQLGKQLSAKELSACYKLDEEDRHFIRRNARNDYGYLVLAVMLKTRQQLGYFIAIEKVPNQIIAYVSAQLKVPENSWLIEGEYFKRTLYRYRSACQKLLGSSAFSDAARNRLVMSVREAALTMSDPADLINVAVAELNKANIELPAFSTLDRLVSHERQVIHDELYLKITKTLEPHQRQSLDALIQVQEGERITAFARMKQTPGPATLKHFRAWADRLVELDAQLDPKPFFDGVAYTKIRQFSAEARAHAISDIRGIIHDAKRHTLLLSLLYETQSTTRDELIDMFLRRMKRVHHSAQDKLREVEESLIGVLGQVLQHTKDCDANETLGLQVRQILHQQGGVDVNNNVKLTHLSL